jgi:hypothetical protein
MRDQPCDLNTPMQMRLAKIIHGHLKMAARSIHAAKHDLIPIPMELRLRESSMTLVCERVKVATSRFQETRVYKTRNYVENSFPGLRIVSASLKKRVQIERLAAHLAEYPQYSSRMLKKSATLLLVETK